jgi:hypothetical protein
MARRNPAFRELEPDKVILTMARLRKRVCERFGGAGLAAVAADLVTLGEEAARRSQALARPYLGLRVLVGIAIAAGLAAILWTLGLFSDSVLYGDDLQGLDAAISVVLAAGAGAWFLLTLEERWKRTRAQRWLHDLRAFAHVIDMHQLTKDPTMRGGPRTTSSPERAMSQFELTRYLEYCAEMLSLLGKLAALYAGQSGDHVIVAAASDVEDLTSDLGRKIWQKIMILAELDGDGDLATEEPAGDAAV